MRFGGRVEASRVGHGPISALEYAHQLNVRGPQELIDRQHAGQPEAGVDQHLGVARKGRRVAGHADRAGDPGAGDLPALLQRAGPGRVDVASFKERYGISRKYAIPLLEYLDRERVTRRAGEARVIL